MKLTQNGIIYFIVFLLMLVLFGWNNIIELRAEEPRRAIVSMEMVLSGDYLVPRINAWSYYNKPPLFNWLMSGFFHLFRSFEEWVVRLPSLLSFLTIAVLNYYISRRYLSKKVALLSSLFFVTSADILFYGSVNAGEIDLFFSLLVFLQVMSIFYFFGQKKILWMFLFSYFFAALGTLTKGPPSIAFQAFTLIPWLVIQGSWRLLFNWKHFGGIFIFLAIVGGYFYAYSFHDNAIGFMIRLFEEASQRTGLESNIWDTIQSFFTFPLFLLKVLAPWFILAIFFLRKDFWKVTKSNSLLHFALIFIIFNIPLYWLTGKHNSRYIFMFFPFFNLLLAYFFLHHPPRFNYWKRKTEQFFGFLMILLTLTFFSLPFISQLQEVENLIWKSTLLILSGSGLIWFYIKRTQFKILVFITFILLLRLGFNIIYLPALAQHSPDLIYRDHINHVLKITGDAPVYWTGYPHNFASDASLGPLKLKETILTTATRLPYQVPYYLTKNNGHVMKYDPYLMTEGFYLSPASFIEPGQDIKILYRFPNLWQQQEFILFKLDENQTGKIKTKYSF